MVMRRWLHFFGPLCTLCSRNVHLFILRITVKNFNDFWYVKILQIRSPHPCQMQHFTAGNPKRSFSTVLFVLTSYYLRYLRKKQTVTQLIITPENVTTLTCEMQSFSI